MTETTATPEGAPGDGSGARERADYVVALLEAERQAENDETNDAMNSLPGAAATSNLDTGRTGDTEDRFDDPDPGEFPSDPELPPPEPETFTVRVNGEELPV